MYGDALYLLAFMTLCSFGLAVLGKIVDWKYERKEKQKKGRHRK